jgi:hypothetical protein
VTWPFVHGTPNGIRTRVATLRGRRQVLMAGRGLHDALSRALASAPSPAEPTEFRRVDGTLDGTPSRSSVRCPTTRIVENWASRVAPARSLFGSRGSSRGVRRRAWSSRRRLAPPRSVHGRGFEAARHAPRSAGRDRSEQEFSRSVPLTVAAPPRPLPTPCFRIVVACGWHDCRRRLKTVYRVAVLTHLQGRLEVVVDSWAPPRVGPHWCHRTSDRVMSRAERATRPPRNQTRGPRMPGNTTQPRRGWALSATMRSRTSPSRTSPVEVERLAP